MKKIRYSAEWFKKVLDSLSDFILVKGEKSKLLWANKSFLDYYGLTQEQLENIIDSPHSDPDDTIQYVRDDHFVFSKGKPLEINEAVTRFDGKINYYLTKKDPVFDENKKVILTVGVSRLIQNESLLEISGIEHQERKTSTSELRSLITALPFPTVMLDAVDRVITFSDQWTETFPASTTITNHFFDELYGQVMPTLNSNIQLAKQQKNNYVGQELETVISGLARIFLIRIKPWLLPNGDVGGTIVIADDVTLLKEAEQKLKKYNEELEDEVRVRTQKLQETLEELKQAQTMLMYHEKQAGLGRMAGSVAHEINNPLAIIEGVTKYLKKNLLHKTLTPQILDSGINDIEETLTRISKIITGLQNISRDSAVLEKKQVRVNDIVRDIQSLSEQGFKKREINFSISFDGLKDHFLFCDRVQFSQVLINLLNNASDAVEELEEKWIKLSFQDQDSMTKITVTDSGHGIEKKIEDKVFEPFFTSKPIGKGTGLGLAISRSIIESHQGSLEIDKSGPNTTFVILLPTEKM